MTLPTLEYDLLTEDGKRGWTGEWFAHENDDSMTPVEKPTKVQFIDETRLFIRYRSPSIGLFHFVSFLPADHGVN